MTTAVPPTEDRFDAAYYRRHYSGPGGVHDRRRVAALATAVHSMCTWWGVPVRSVLDVGAGVGMWRDWYRQEHPRVRVRSIDISEYACRRYGHEQRDIAQWRPPRPSDLTVCHGVLQYVPDRDAERAIEHLAAGTRSVLYLEVPTAHDLAHIVDPTASDVDVHARSAAWYRRRLAPHFQQAGVGLWLRHGVVHLYELEHAAR
jgi:trans-aconitate methyltransferase